MAKPGLRDGLYVERNEIYDVVDGRIGELPFPTEAEVAEDIATAVAAEETARKADVDAEETGRKAVELKLNNLTIFNVKDYGAKGDNATDDAATIQEAIDAAEELGGGIVWVPSGIYLVGTTLVLPSDVELVGAGPGASIIKLKNSGNTDTLKTKGYGVTTCHNFTIKNLSFDGNKANNTTGSGLLIDGVTFLIDWVFIYNYELDGLVERKTEEDGELRAFGEMDAYLQNTKVWDCERYGIDWDGHDCHWTNVVSISNEQRNFLVNTNAAALKAVSCHAYGGATYGWEFKASANCVNCEAEGGKTAQVLLNSDHVKWLGGEVFTDDIGEGPIGFLWAEDKGFNCVIRPTKVKGCDEGAFKFISSGGNSHVSVGLVEQEGGVVVAGTPSESVQFDIGPVVSPIGEEGEVAELGFLNSKRSVYVRQPELSEKEGEENETGSIIRANIDSTTGFSLDDTSGGHYYQPPGASNTPASAASPAAFAWEFARITVPNRTRLTGVTYRVGSTSNGSVRVGIYNSAGTKLAGSSAKEQPAASQIHKIPFTATVVLDPGDYFVLLQYSSGTATSIKTLYLVPSGTATGANFDEIPPTITPATEPSSTTRPILCTY